MTNAKIVARAMLVLLTLFLLFGVSASRAAERKEYVVKKGDTLGQIIFVLSKEHVDVTRVPDWNPRLATQVQVGEKIVYWTPDAPAPTVTLAQAEAIADQSARKAMAMAPKPDPSPAVNMYSVWKWVGITIPILALSLALVVRRRKHATQALASSLSPATSSNAETVERYPLTDPDAPAIDVHAGRLGTTVPILISLKKEGVRVPCNAESRQQEHLSPVVWFEGHSESVAWDKRRTAAAVAYQRNPACAVPIPDPQAISSVGEPISSTAN